MHMCRACDTPTTSTSRHWRVNVLLMTVVVAISRSGSFSFPPCPMTTTTTSPFSHTVHHILIAYWSIINRILNVRATPERWRTLFDQPSKSRSPAMRRRYWCVSRVPNRRLLFVLPVVDQSSPDWSVCVVYTIGNKEEKSPVLTTCKQMLETNQLGDAGVARKPRSTAWWYVYALKTRPRRTLCEGATADF